MKSCPDLFHAEGETNGRTDRHDEAMFAFCNFANALQILVTNEFRVLTTFVLTPCVFERHATVKWLHTLPEARHSQLASHTARGTPQSNGFTHCHRHATVKWLHTLPQARHSQMASHTARGTPQSTGFTHCQRHATDKWLHTLPVTVCPALSDAKHGSVPT